MNAVARQTEFAATVEEPRHRFTVDDVLTMMRTGLLTEGAREELIEGELVEMPADGVRHKDYTIAVGGWLFSSLGTRFAILPGSTLVLSEFNAPSPDWHVFDPAIATADVRGPDVLLAIEQSDSSVRRDLGWKARLYAQHGVRDYWVIEVEAQRIHVHREPGPDGYGAVRVFERADDVEALLIPGLTLRIADLPRVGG